MIFFTEQVIDREIIEQYYTSLLNFFCGVGAVSSARKTTQAVDSLLTL